MWFTEESAPPAIVVAILAAVNLFVWYQNQKPLVLAPMVLWIGAGIAAFAVDAAVVTEKEKVAAAIPRLIEDFRSKDLNRFLGNFSKAALIYRALATTAIQKVELGNDVSLRDVSVKMLAADSRATTRFRVQGTVTYDSINLGTHPSRWELGWRKEEGEWRILTVTRLNPLKHEPMEVFGK